MNAITRLMNHAAVMLTLGLIFLAQPTAAQSNCKDAKGNFVDVYGGSGNTTSGTVTNAGILNGTTLTVFTSGAFPTPVATIVSYTGEMTLTTTQGQLKTSNVFLYDFATGLFTVLLRINPATSTGSFAGATGVLYVNGKTINGNTYPSEIRGEICSTK